MSTTSMSTTSMSTASIWGPSTILPTAAQLQRLYQGCAFAEGPAADGNGQVYFSDCPNNRILVYRPVAGQPVGITEIWQEPSLRANGMNFDAQGRLVVCCDGKDGGARAVRRYETDGSITTLASHYQGKKLNAPNDLCFDHEGRIYFTDPRYGYQGDLEQDCMAVYCLEQDGSLTRVIEDAEMPNGILMTPDNRTIYLVDHNPAPGGARTLLAYDQDAQGRWRRRAVLHDFGTGHGGDGMALDVAGNIYLTAGKAELAGIHIFAPNGDKIGFIATDETPGNCTFGGPDLQTLYIAASSSLYAIRLKLPGYLAYPRLG
ncbi:MAG: SMP-30/gluconolactonase/LRE family protein [Caldilineaceae bacterium]|nr:SMP-30/gluconolactonase/LRE family protein [Caldilineaceae bacterium]